MGGQLLWDQDPTTERQPPRKEVKTQTYANEFTILVSQSNVDMIKTVAFIFIFGSAVISIHTTATVMKVGQRT